jgi:methylamine dehydrogenase accessory protein MauD
MSGVWLASYLVLWLVVLVLAFLLAGSLRQLGLMQLRLGDDPGALITDSGLERGAQAPEFVAADSETGEAVALSSLPAVPRLLVFASPGCLSCRELIPGLNEVRKTRGGEFDFLVVCRGDIESCRGFGRMNRLEAPMVVDTNGQIEKDYMVTLTPFAYVLDHEGRVVIRGVANDWRQLESLLEQEGTLQAGRGWVDVDNGGNGDGTVVAEGEQTHG